MRSPASAGRTWLARTASLKVQMIIYDFDGVIADSEVVANAVLAEMVTDLGTPASREDSYRLFMGKRFTEVAAAIEALTGRPLPATFAGDYQHRLFARFREGLCEVPGFRAYQTAFRDRPACIASSSAPERLALCLDVLGLTAAFGQRVFSAAMVPQGKSAPDIFLHAAGEMGIAPPACLVLEDSVSGVVAGKAAGMTVIGLLAASHVNGAHGAKLKAAGADFIAGDFREAEQQTWQWLSINDDGEGRIPYKPA
ncbi:MAG TPA: HAD family phosphatase [Hyphomicrobiaceae bacterium]|nr:HAD family phosphatase [Hyphomicrobiaceae bacterium]